MIRREPLMITILGISIFILTMFFLPKVDEAKKPVIKGADKVTIQHFDGKDNNWLTTKNPKQLEAAGGITGPVLWGDKENETGWHKLYQPAKITGVQINGMFGDSSFVIRVPDKWNGKLVVTAPGGYSNETANDVFFSDYVLEKGYAYASTDKGTPGGDNALEGEENSIAEWNMRFNEITKATQDYLAENYQDDLIKEKKNPAIHLVSSEHPIPTYIMGFSNGGYVIRYALENDSEGLFDGGIDMAGVLWRADDPNLITSYTEMVNNADNALFGKGKKQEKAIQAIYDAGMPEGIENIWFLLDQNKWFNTLNRYRDELDPNANKQIDWTEYTSFNQFGLRDRSNDYIFNGYNFLKRPKKEKKLVKEIENTGEIQHPLITVFGTWDETLFPSVHAYPYEELVIESGKKKNYRLYMIDKAGHGDNFVWSEYDKNHERQPILPYVHQSFDLLVNWVEKGKQPPESKLVDTPKNPVKVIDLKNEKEIDPY